MFLIVLFPLLAIATIAAVAIASDAQHEDRWVVNDNFACCEERANQKGIKGFTAKNVPAFAEFEAADIAA
jgi:hypothetical protein